MTKTEVYNIFIENQKKYLMNKEKNYLKEKSQFFTPIPIVERMIETIEIEKLNKENIKILEPSAGGGILILSLLLNILEKIQVKEVYIVAYENDKEMYKVLEENMNVLITYINKISSCIINIKLYNKNFILHNKAAWNKEKIKEGYDIIISNPPYKKINQKSKEAQILHNIVFGQPNIYTLFMALSLSLLNNDGIYVVLSPRNYLSGMYNEKLRKYIFTNFVLNKLHSFYNRNYFKDVSQEIIISTFQRRKYENIRKKICISYNDNCIGKFYLEEIMYDDRSKAIIIPKSKKDMSLYMSFSKMENTIDSLNMKVSVGPVVQFRESLYLKKELYNKDYAPLLVGKDLAENNIMYFERVNIRKTHNKSISIKSKKIIKNSNYVILRKVMAKDDNNILVPVVLSKDFFTHEFIGIDNNLLYFHKKYNEKELSIEECYGIYCYINSIVFKEYYCLINSTHTININDFNNIRFPNIKTINEFGKNILRVGRYDKQTCNKIVLEKLHSLFNSNTYE